MQSIYVIIAFVIGALLGGGVLWLLLRARLAQEREKTLAEGASEIATLKERNASRMLQIEESKASLAAADNQLNELRNSLQAESQKRSAADEKASRVPALESAVSLLTSENTELKKLLSELGTRIEEERKAAEGKLEILNDARSKLADAFKALSAEALRGNNQSFIELAKATLEKFQEGAKTDLESRQKAIDEIVKPVRESLNKVDEKIQELEKSRVAAYSTLTEQVKSLASTQTQLKDETGKLVKALRSPTVRGRWGEIQLKRVVEMAGMLNYCDFVEQESVNTEGGMLRPDMIVRLPGQKNVVVDSKAPLEAYLNSIEATDEEHRVAHLKSHARHIREHMAKLSSKNYCEHISPTPEFVIMFLPGEAFFSSALEQDPGLIEEGVNQKVIPASPTTLIALLRAVAYGWRQETIARSAQEISNLGQELYNRLRTMAEHMEKMGHDLEKTVDSYNKAVGSLETRVMVSARKFTELGAGSGDEIPELSPVEKTPRQLQSSLTNDKTSEPE